MIFASAAKPFATPPSSFVVQNAVPGAAAVPSGAAPAPPTVGTGWPGCSEGAPPARQVGRPLAIAVQWTVAGQLTPAAAG